MMSVAIVGGMLTGAATVTASMVSAAPKDSVLKGVNATGQQSSNSLQDNIKTIVNVILYLLGAIAVIMIVIGGLRYTVSGGDSNATTGAKNTILFAVVGLIIAVLAYAIVNFVLKQFT